MTATHAMTTTKTFNYGIIRIATPSYYIPILGSHIRSKGLFKIFLKRQIHHLNESKHVDKKQKARLQNRRSSERYEIKQGCLTILNDFDMLVVKDLSLQGFHSKAPQRALERLSIGDIYEARSRHNNKPFDIQIKVAWIREDHVGFEFVELNETSRKSISSLVRPLKIAGSMNRIDADFISAQSPEKIWYHGDDNSDLFIWKKARDYLNGWQFILGNKYLEWQPDKGLNTGSMLENETSTSGILDAKEKFFLQDESLNQDLILFTYDVFSALDYEDKDELIATLPQS